MLVTHQLAFRLLKKNICCSLREKCKVWSTLVNAIFIYPNVVDLKLQELRFNCPGSVIRFSAQSAQLSSRRAFHLVLADERHSLLSFSEQTSDVESGPWLYYTDNYLVQFDECHFLMASLGEKSCNDVVAVNVRANSERDRCDPGSLGTTRCLPSDGQSHRCGHLMEAWSSWDRSDPTQEGEEETEAGTAPRIFAPLSACECVPGLQNLQNTQFGAVKMFLMQLFVQFSFCQHLWNIDLFSLTHLQIWR